MLGRVLLLSINGRYIGAEFLDEVESQKRSYQQGQQQADDRTQHAFAYQHIAFAEPAAPTAVAASVSPVRADHLDKLFLEAASVRAINMRPALRTQIIRQNSLR